MYQEHADFTWELTSHVSDIPTHGPEGWRLCGHPGAQGEPWGASRDMGEEEHRLDRRAKTLRGYHETLAEEVDIGSYLAN